MIDQHGPQLYHGAYAGPSGGSWGKIRPSYLAIEICPLNEEMNVKHTKLTPPG